MKELLFYLKPIYKQNAKKVCIAIKQYLQGGVRFKPPADPYWHKSLNVYSVYPDAVIYDKKLSPLRNLTTHLKMIKSLGCNAAHILPFLESPMCDKGYDVSNYFKIRKDLGSVKDLIQLRSYAKQLNVHLFMDLVLNHVSDQHIWFKKAVQGDKYYRKFFLTTNEKPIFIKKIHKSGAVYAIYRVKGLKKYVNIAFPEHAGTIPHWRYEKDCWYYHTFYPEQIDLNWLNPEVFIEMARVIIFWAKYGFSFRFDAMPYVGKAAYKITDGENNTCTHLILAALKYLLRQVNPNSALLTESFENMDEVTAYLGSDEVEEADLAYNFHLNTAIWSSLVYQNTRFLWEKINRQKWIPNHAAWLNFLRNHDELSLAHLGQINTQHIRDAIAKYGKDFREGHGISGRIFSLLGENKRKFTMAYFLLASFPGAIMLLYGDEIAFKNVPEEKLTKTEKKDSRNINRGVLSAEDYQTPESQKFISFFQNLLGKRKLLKDYFNQYPKRIKAIKEIYAASHKLPEAELLVYINLAEMPQTITIDSKSFPILIEKVNRAKLCNNELQLGAFSGVWLWRSRWLSPS